MACTNHPASDSPVAPCALCGRSFCRDCLIEFEHRPVCASCKAAALAEVIPPPRKPGVPAGNVPPWERAAELGWWTAFWRTVSEVMTRPGAFFAAMESDSTTWTWLWLPVITHTAAAVTSALANVIVFVGLGQILGGGPGGGGGSIGSVATVQSVVAVLGIAFAPVAALISTFLWAGCIHLWLGVSNRSRRPFTQTVRGVSYSYAAYVVAVVPFVGQFIGAIWCAVANYKMVRNMHGTGRWTAFFAVTWLLLLCCGGYAAVITSAYISAR